MSRSKFPAPRMARYRDGLSSRSGIPGHEIQLRVDPIQPDFDEEVEGLRSRVVLLKSVAQDIETETKYQNELLNQLDATMKNAQAGIASTMRRLKRSLAVNGGSHLTHVVFFALLCFLGVYLWVRFFK